MTGTSYYSGATVVRAGTLSLAADASEVGDRECDDRAECPGRCRARAGQRRHPQHRSQWPDPDRAGGQLDRQPDDRQRRGEQRRKPGYIDISGGLGKASLIFQQNYAADSTSTIYQFQNLIAGSTCVIQDGPGTTQLMRANTYTGGTLVSSRARSSGFHRGRARQRYGADQRGYALPGGRGDVLERGGDHRRRGRRGGAQSRRPLHRSARRHEQLGNGRSTTCQLLQGEASAATTLQISCSPSSHAAANDGMRCSDIYSIEGINNLFVLQLTVENASPASFSAGTITRKISGLTPSTAPLQLA